MIYPSLRACNLSCTAERYVGSRYRSPSTEKCTICCHGYTQVSCFQTSVTVLQQYVDGQVVIATKADFFLRAHLKVSHPQKIKLFWMISENKLRMLYRHRGLSMACRFHIYSLNCRYLQLKCTYLQFNCRYLQLICRYLQFNWRYQIG